MKNIIAQHYTKKELQTIADYLSDYASMCDMLEANPTVDGAHKAAKEAIRQHEKDEEHEG